METQRNNAPIFSRKGLQAIDRDAVEQYGMSSLVLMENAGKGAAEVILHSMDSESLKDIVVVCGNGNNGGDGYVAARHLVNNGCCIHILALGTPKSQDAKTNATIGEKMGIKIHAWSGDMPASATLFIDGVFGTGLERNVDGMYAKVINAINKHVAPCVALDIPSGLDCDSGKPLGSCIEANMTVSFVGIKQGFLHNSANQFLGETVVVDIGCPNALLRKYAFPRT